MLSQLHPKGKPFDRFTTAAPFLLLNGAIHLLTNFMYLNLNRVCACFFMFFCYPPCAISKHTVAKSNTCNPSPAAKTMPPCLIFHEPCNIKRSQKGFNEAKRLGRECRQRPYSVSLAYWYRGAHIVCTCFRSIVTCIRSIVLCFSLFL